MRIAQVSPLMESVPPQLYGGTERVVSYLTEELVGLGHDVTLFASGDSSPRPARRRARPGAAAGPGAAATRSPHHMRMLERGAPPRPTSSTSCTSTSTTCTSRCSAACATPTVTTLHGRLDLPDLPPSTAPSRHAAGLDLRRPARADAAGANWARTVHHGLPPRPASASARSPAATWRSSAASRRRSAPTAPSRSPAAPACR